MLTPQQSGGGGYFSLPPPCEAAVLTQPFICWELWNTGHLRGFFFPDPPPTAQAFKVVFANCQNFIAHSEATVCCCCGFSRSFWRKAVLRASPHKPSGYRHLSAWSCPLYDRSFERKLLCFWMLTSAPSVCAGACPRRGGLILLSYIAYVEPRFYGNSKCSVAFFYSGWICSSLGGLLIFLLSTRKWSFLWSRWW